jgi:maltose alpha-D-glucosyltransferase/alpha-amylase
LISVRKSTLAFGRGTMTFIRPANRAVLAYVRQYRDEAILCVANLSRSAQATELDLSAFKERIPLEMMGRTRFPAIGELPYMVTLGPYGFYWFDLQERDKSVAPAPRTMQEFETLVVPLGSTWASLARTRGIFEHDVLPGHLSRTRWYPEHRPAAIHPVLVSAVPFCDIGDNKPWLVFFEATQDDRRARYVLPMQTEWMRFDREHYNPNAFAAVRQGAREGTLLDVATSPIFIGLFLRNLRQSLIVEENGLRLEFWPTSKFAGRIVREPQRVELVESSRCATTALVDGEYVVRLYRKLETGIHPAIEVGRFLTEVAGFANSPALLGSAELVEDGDNRSAIATVHAFVLNQGDGWTVSAAYLDRFVDKQRLLAKENAAAREEQAPYLRYMAQAGKRTAELHLALASNIELADFAPEPARAADVARWTDEVTAQADRAFDALSQRRDTVREFDRALVDRVLALRDNLHRRLASLLAPDIGGSNIRLHGDFQLRRLLIVKDDIFIAGFDGDQSRPLEQQRRKAPAARDLAGMIRSIEHSVAAAYDRVLRGTPDEHGKLAGALTDWGTRAAGTFLDFYREAMTNARLWPADPHTTDALVNFFLLERMLGEIEDALLNRPDWLRIPLNALLRTLSETASET